MGEGECFGEIAVLIEGKRTASIVAETYVEAYELSKEALVAALEHYPEQKKALVRVGEERLINDMKKARKAARAVQLPDHPMDEYARRVKVVAELVAEAVSERRAGEAHERAKELVAIAGAAMAQVPERLSWLRGATGTARNQLRALLESIFGDGPPKRKRPDLDEVASGCTELAQAARAMVFTVEMGECLLRVPFLAKTDEAFRDALLRESTVHDYDDNAKLINAGEAGHELFFLVDGAVEVILPNGARVGNLVTGEYFGENGVFSDALRTASVWAITPVTAAVLTRDGLERVFAARADGEALRASIVEQHDNETKTIEFERLSLRRRFKESLRVLAAEIWARSLRSFRGWSRPSSQTWPDSMAGCSRPFRKFVRV
ncbi:uncharacterized protein AMSG_12454 [Thecamonas trahens ATCC 50062]|uniref:Cyclic nucleotide-binding domain-containing protein n=1 Tax=Thecamonas trahens ATCC 50062 TaxID=461836 RepID=A0A0L0DVL1_THETB|nr:hypothetical protein AMSG_12454 [Thecamonas trahens ATCC 50062]KNC56212.1 hypothetical protein AMSG_12454 [Thecamonas trahens ATCC 50062]|eukprot:XP_013752664.1 hypothetical protein AMSG_12454 [Thecamonas trahens ATCC 50062]